MKAYTDLEQSKKLAEFLPLKSADMCFANDGTSIKIDANPYNVRKLMCKDYVVEVIPCWSLAALLELIPSNLDSSTLTIEKCDSEPFKYGLNYHDRWGREDDIQTKYYDDLVDACYEMILKLNEQKLL